MGIHQSAQAPGKRAPVPGMMQGKMKLGDFLVAYLEKIGVSHLFGIPGDLVINLFFKFGRRRGLKIITLSHEPGVGFAADGYARATGRIGAICVTYGAGGHNMVNPVAASFIPRPRTSNRSSISTAKSPAPRRSSWTR